MFQQSSDSPHIAQECDHGLETRVCCCEEAPHDSLDTRERGFSTEENKGECNDRLDPSQIREGDGGPSLSCETATALLHNGSSEDKRACACENSDTDCTAQVESSAAGVVSTGDIGDSSDGLQSNSESIAYRTSSCGQQKEEADKADDLVCESQEKGHNSVEEKALEEKELSERSPTAESGDMGITQSLDTPESSDVESCSQGAETDDEEEDGCGDLIEPEEMREESKEPLEGNPDGDCSKHENEMHVCRDVCDETGDPGSHKLEGSEGGVCENIRCNVEGNQDNLDSSRTSDQEDANEEFQETLEMPYVETDSDQQEEELSTTSAAEHESVSCLHEINQELPPVENPITSIEDAVEVGSEVDGQRLLSSSYILQTEPEPEPGSPTGTSEDTLEPEDLEVLLGSGCEGMENVQENQENKPICETQATLEEVLESVIPADMEKVNLPDDQDPRQDMTSNNEVMQGTSEIESSEGNSDKVFVNTNKSGDQDTPVLVESNKSGISEESLAVNAEDLMSVLVYSDHVDGTLHVSKALDKDDIIDSSVCPEQARERFNLLSQDAESAVHEVGQPVGEEDLLKGELNDIFMIYHIFWKIIFYEHYKHYKLLACGKCSIQINFSSHTSLRFTHVLRAWHNCII